MINKKIGVPTSKKGGKYFLSIDILHILLKGIKNCQLFFSFFYSFFPLGLDWNLNGYICCSIQTPKRKREIGLILLKLPKTVTGRLYFIICKPVG